MFDSTRTLRTAPLLTVSGAALALAASLVACGGDGGDGGPAPLALGKEAVVAYTSPASGDTPAVDTEIGVTVRTVRTGTIDELEANGLQVDDVEEGNTPYYVDVHYTNAGSGGAQRLLTVGMETDDGTSISSTIVMDLAGTGFAPCSDAEPGPLAPGDAYDDCALFLVPEGEEPEVIRFVSQAKDATITFTEWKVA